MEPWLSNIVEHRRRRIMADGKPVRNGRVLGWAAVASRPVMIDTTYPAVPLVALRHPAPLGASDARERSPAFASMAQSGTGQELTR